MKKYILFVLIYASFFFLSCTTEAFAKSINENNTTDADIIIPDIDFHEGILNNFDNEKKSIDDSFFEDESTPTQKVSKEITVTATAYTASCPGCTGITYTGLDLNSNPNHKVIAVDPNVIPLGSKVYVENYGTAIAGDIGSAIKGKRIDVFIPSKAKADDWGVQKVNVKILS